MRHRVYSFKREYNTADMGTIRVRDDVGTIHEFAAPPRRIVSLVPSLTESVIALGGADRLVGVTEWCIHPADVVKSIPKVRGTKNPYIQKILELEPDLVLANHEENRERHVVELRRYVPVFLTYPRTVFDALKTIKDLSRVKLFPDGMFLDNIDEYIRTTTFIHKSMNKKSIPNRKTAFEFAYTIEKSSGELHFQETARKRDPDKITRIFMRLNGMDLDHANRILEYQKTIETE